jgi:hypothetical protein
LTNPHFFLTINKEEKKYEQEFHFLKFFSTKQINQTKDSLKFMKKISLEDWEKKIEKIKLDKSDLNKLVMNYLVVEGFKEAAENFREESNTSSK